MKSQACEPCAKRKVRCDRAEPACSNCKRRKHDHCSYPEISPSERIKRLEETVRLLGGDPSSTSPEKPPIKTSDSVTTGGSTAETPLMLQDEGRSIYLESEGWQTWISTSRLQGKTKSTSYSTHESVHHPGRHLPHAFDGSPWPRTTSNLLSEETCPIPVEDAKKLWDIFMQRVDPVMKINFKWSLHYLRTALDDSGRWRSLSTGDQTTILAVCLFGNVTLNNTECMESFGRSRSLLLKEYRSLCEASFTRTNMLAIEDISTLKALCLYMKACIDLVTVQSLWTLMGLASRSAEQLGIHRDGQLLGLAPIETEERRRLWWQLQHLDLILAIKSGVTPLIFTAEWDSKLPLNIEDGDISVSSTTMPKERIGLTSMSYTLFTYWMIAHQRSFRGKQINQISLVDRSLLGPLTDNMIVELEQSLQKVFLQYCDPVKAVDAILQISARAVLCVLRLRRLHEIRLAVGKVDGKIQDEYFETCLQSLKYNNVSFSLPHLKPFYWLAEASFVWHAFIGLLVDTSQLTDPAKMKEAWAVIEDLYNVTPFLKDLSEDKRRAYAANSVIATWSASAQRLEAVSMQKPAFIYDLENRVSELAREEGHARDASHTGADVEDDANNASFTAQINGIGDPFNFSFDDIDWSFWDAIS